jgi:hypothetical protein
MKAVGCRRKAVGRKSMRPERIEAFLCPTSRIDLTNRIRARLSFLATAYSLQPTALGVLP